jgi:hypothetical protein
VAELLRAAFQTIGILFGRPMQHRTTSTLGERLMTLDEQFDHHAITADVAKMAREANDEIKKLEATIVARDDELDRLNHRIAAMATADERDAQIISDIMGEQRYARWCAYVGIPHESSSGGSK